MTLCLQIWATSVLFSRGDFIDRNYPVGKKYIENFENIIFTVGTSVGTLFVATWLSIEGMNRIDTWFQIREVSFYFIFLLNIFFIFLLILRLKNLRMPKNKFAEDGKKIKISDRLALALLNNHFAIFLNFSVLSWATKLDDQVIGELRIYWSVLQLFLMPTSSLIQSSFRTIFDQIKSLNRAAITNFSKENINFSGQMILLLWFSSVFISFLYQSSYCPALFSHPEF